MAQNFNEIKYNIMSYLNDELDKMQNQIEVEKSKLLSKIEEYESEIQQLRTENDSLLFSLAEQQEKLFNKDTSTLEKDYSFLLDFLLKNSNVASIKDIFHFLDEEKREEEAIFLQLNMIVRLIEKDLAKFISIGLDMITDSLKSINNVSESWINPSYKIIKYIFQNFSLNIAEIDEIYFSAFKFAQSFVDTPYYKNLYELLDKEAEFIISNSMDINETAIIDELLKTYFLYELDENLNEILNRIIEEWEFIDAQLTLEQYSRILWYAMYYGKDHKIVSKSRHASSYLGQNVPEMRLYDLYNKLYQERRTSSQEYKHLARQLTVFNNFEKAWIFEPLEERLELNAIKETNEVEDSSTFKWPSTEVIVHAETEDFDSTSVDLKEKSVLRQLGYQITGLDRNKRWSVLVTEALPKLGLKKTAYTIAYLVRSRKKMKNGPIKNRYAIGEWEHDLVELKKHFYRNDFVWPKIEN